MHETRLVNTVIAEILNKNVRRAKLRIGRMHARADIFEELFKAQSKGTPAEGVELTVEEVPVKIRCQCGYTGHVRVLEHVHFVRCPHCNEIAEPITGKELEIIY